MKLLKVLFLSLFSFVFYGQTPKIIPVSPEAAALFKMINYPISYNTGVPNINIPFYEISLGNLKLPIQLDYHAGGFKVNEKSTRVGLGWSLSCDLQITRSINGGDDLSLYGYINNSLVKSHNPEPSNASNNYPFYDNSLASNYKYRNTYRLYKGWDAMPDKFSYKLLNKSGSFYFQKNNAGTGYTIVPVPYDNVKITYNESNRTFKIIDTDGTTYVFGVGGEVQYDSVYERLDNIENVKREYSNTQSITAWKCDRVISNNKIDEIVFNYVPKEVDKRYNYNDMIEYYSTTFCPLREMVGSNQWPLSQGSTFSDYQGSWNDVPFYRISNPKYVNHFWNKAEIHIPYINNGGLVDKIYTSNSIPTAAFSNSSILGLSLSAITFRGGKVVFDGANLLTSIQVFDDKNVEIKSLRLFQQTIRSTTNGSQSKGTIYLDSLHLKNNSEVFQRYGLKYKTKFDYGDHLKGRDVWGYPNHTTQTVGAGIDVFSIPKKTILEDVIFNPTVFTKCTGTLSNQEIEIGGNDKWSEEPDGRYLDLGILERITYPTGGSTLFNFELNKYKQRLTSTYTNNAYSQKVDQLGGGLRIRSISNFDKNYNLVSKKYYRYGDFEEGTGIVMSEPQRSTEPNNYCYELESYKQELLYLQGSTYSNDCQNPAFPCIKYICNEPSCMQTLFDETKTTYRPTSSLDYTYPNGASIYYTKVTEYNQDFGRQTGKTVYKYYKPEEFFSPYAKFISRNIIPQTNIPFIKTDWMMGAQESIETYKYDSNTRLFRPVHKKKFEYTRYDLPIQVKVIYTFQNRIATVVEGTDDIGEEILFNAYSGTSSISGEYGLPMGKLLVSKEIEETFDDSSIKTNTSTFTYGKLPFLNPSKITTTDSKGNIIELDRKYAYDYDGDYDLMESENMVSQLVEEINTNKTKVVELSRKKINYEKITEGWGFFAPKTIQTSVKGQALTTDLTYTKYDQFGAILEFKGKDNVPTSYLWGYNNLYPVAELKNVSYGTIPSTFISNTTIADPASETSILSVLTNLRNTYSNPNQAVSTFTYKRQVGVTSMTNPIGNTMYFEYDAIGRLKFQKDNLYNVIKKNEYNYNTNNKFKIITDTIGANNNIIDRLDGWGEEYDAFDCKCLASDAANVEMLYTYHKSYIEGSSANTSPGIILDLIQNETIIASQRIRGYDMFGSLPVVSSNILLPEGEYVLSFRMNADVRYVNGEVIDFSIEEIESNTKNYINSGDTFNFQKGKHYKISVHNFRI